MLLRRRLGPKTSRTCPIQLTTCFPDDRVESVVFEVTDGEHEMANDDYQRIQAPLGLGEWDEGSRHKRGGAGRATRACGSGRDECMGLRYMRPGSN